MWLPSYQRLIRATGLQCYKGMSLVVLEASTVAQATPNLSSGPTNLEFCFFGIGAKTITRAAQICNLKRNFVQGFRV